MMESSPRVLKGGIVLMDAATGSVQRIISLQYNPETVSRSLQTQAVELQQGGDRSEALRLTGPPVETIKLDAEIDATDQLQSPTEGANQVAVQFGIQPALAALETIIYPTSSHLRAVDAQQSGGALEVAPFQAPLTIFVWSKSRIVPVRITEFSIEEQFFDPELNPIRAKISLSMRVLNVNDLGFRHRGGSLFMHYHQQKEKLAAMQAGGTFSSLGIGGIPS